MTSTSGAEPGNEVPEADWAEQQTAAEPTDVETPVGGGHASTTEADTADLADQDQEVVLDEEG